MSVGKNIESIRKVSGLSQDEVAITLGISRPFYNALEKGSRVPTQKELQQLSELFGVRSEEIIGGALKYSAKDYGEKANSIDEIRYRNLILYLTERVGAMPNVGETVIYKLIYFIETYFLFKTGRAMVGESFYKRQFGPVPVNFRKLTDKMVTDEELDIVTGRFYTYLQKKYLPRTKAAGLTQEEVSNINHILNILGDKSATELSDLSHYDEPWIKGDDGELLDITLINSTSPEFSKSMGRS